MKNLLILFYLSTIFISCKEKTQNSNVNNEILKKEVHSLLNNWHIAAAEANYNDYFNKMDSTSIFIGTDASEIWTKTKFEKFSKPYFDKGKAWSFTVLKRNIYTSNNNEVIWFDEILNTWMGTCRGSGVLEKDKKDNWKIKHYVLSVAIPNDDIKSVIHAKKEKDSIFRTNFK